MKKVNNLQRAAAFVLILALGMVQIEYIGYAQTVFSQESEIVGVGEHDSDLELGKDQNPDSSPEQKVRVIVELNQNSIVDEAIQKNMSYEDLEESFIQDKEEEIAGQQEQLIREIDARVESEDLSELKQYDTIINGIALQVDKEEIEKIEGIQDVKNVYISEEFERPFLESSTQSLGAGAVWNSLHYKGEGTVVAVIDSGIDYAHDAFTLDDPAKAALSEEKIREMIRADHLRGKYYSEKIPYGYNYYDYNYNLFDSYGQMHGMHVSGIVGANDAQNGIYGVAPNAQILAMKVFSDDIDYPTTFTDIWLKALDDAIALKADVVNMSLGSPAGFSIEGENYPEGEILKKARDAGILVAVAAGNDATITEGNTYNVNPLAENYDTALIANPALDETTIAVAALENTQKQSHMIRWKEKIGRRQREHMALVDIYAPDGTPHKLSGSLTHVSENVVIHAGFGALIRNQFVLLELPKKDDKSDKFQKKLEALAEYTPRAIIVANTEEMGEKLGSSLKTIGRAANTVIVRIKRSTYNKFVGFPYYGSVGEMEIYTKTEATPNPNASQMSAFSSWGPTPDLRIKPEITAVGGWVNSTAENGKYKSMSGTSMASPHVAGASAIVKQYLMEKNISTDNTSDFIKLLLMNTATVQEAEKNGQKIPYFVRQQGSGLLNLEHAVQTPVVVRATGTNDEISDGKLELKELSEKRFMAHLALQNFGTQEKRYSISARAVYEPKNEQDGAVYRTQKSALVDSAQNAKTMQISVQPGEIKELDLELDYTDSSQIEWNNYIEGFIQLKDMDQQIDLGIPFLGFYGDWDQQDAIDAFAVTEEGRDARNVQFYVNRDNNMRSSLFTSRHKLSLPVVDNIIYFAPNSLYYSHVDVRLAPLRNMESIEYSILDKNTREVLHVIGKSINVRKLSRLGRNNSFIPMPDSSWDGRINDVLVKDGEEYIYQIKAKLNNRGIGGEGIQLYPFVLRVDEGKPEIDQQKLRMENTGDRKRRMTLQVQDSGSGVARVYLQSLKFTQDMQATPSEPEKREGLDVPPGSIQRPPVIDPLQMEMFAAPGGDSLEYDQTKFKGVPKYGKHTVISLIDSPTFDGKVLPKVENGRVFISDDLLGENPLESKEIYVFRNGHRNEEIEISAPYYADSTHIYISALDHIGNKTFAVMETGEQDNFHTLNFMNFYNSIKDRQAEIRINGEKLEKSTYDSMGKNVKISIKMPDDEYHISTLYFKRSRSVNYLLRDDVVQAEEAKKYQYRYNRADKTLEFQLDLDTNYEIWMEFAKGAMHEPPTEGKVEIDLGEIGIENFRQIKINNKPQTVTADHPVLEADSGLQKLEFVFANMPGKRVQKILITEDGQEKELKRLFSSFDPEEGKFGYYAGGYSIKITHVFAKNAKLNVIYADQAGQGTLSSELLADEAENGRIDESGERIQNEHIVGKNLEERMKEISQDALATASDARNTNDSKDKYPAIFIQSPNLLDVLTVNNTVNGEVELRGFIGYIAPDDEIITVQVHMLDNDGEPIGEALSIANEELTKKATTHTARGVQIYAGDGYHFKTKLPLDAYNVNIRVEVVTRKGKYASVVRRALYDKFIPELEYSIEERALDDSEAVLNVRIYDESIKLKLYRDSSLVRTVDKVSISLLHGGVSAEEKIRIKLKEGQNAIRLKAVDLANYANEKTVYIYRIQPQNP